MSAELVSVVIPRHDAAPFLAEAIDSALAQAGGEVEVVVVDDASTDGSLAVAEGFGAAVRLVRLESNRGAAHARNRGVAAARGTALLFLDADDVLGPGTLRALLAALRGGPAGAAVCPWGYLRRVDGRWTATPADRPLPDPAGDPLGGWLAGTWAPTNSILWCRRAFELTGGWDERLTLNDDGDLMMRALAGGMRLAVADAGMAYYRRHGEARVSVSADVYSEERLLSGVRVLEKIGDLLERQGRLEEGYARSIGLAYHHLALLAFRGRHWSLGRECLRRGEAGAGRQALDRTAVGRLLTRLLGLERKERVAAAIARAGIATGPQRVYMRLRHARRAGPRSEVG
jgi:O-antigen biosynthesis protein